MKVVLSKNDVLTIETATDDVHNPVKHICRITPYSTIFTFDHGCIRVDGDCVTVSPYIDGKETQKYTLNMTTLRQRLIPTNWYHIHHPYCGTKYRGCHPSKCPKDQYEKTGTWKDSIS